MSILYLLSGVAGMVLLGRVCADALGLKSSTAETWGLSILLDMSGISWISFFWSYAGGFLGGPLAWGLTSIGVISYGLTCLLKRSAQVTESQPPCRSSLVSVCQWLIGILIVVAVVQALLTPQRFWDERAIFGIKAKVLWTERTIHSNVLQNPEFAQGHPRYPLLIPLAEQHIYALLGEVEDRWPKVLFPLMYAGLGLTFAGVMSRRFGDAWGWLGALLILLTPVLMPSDYGFISAQGDAPVAALHGAAVLFLWDALQAGDRAAQRQRIVLAALLAASVAFTKDEGIAFLLVDMLSWGLAIVLGLPEQAQTWRSAVKERFLRPAWLFFPVIVSVLLTPWFLHRQTLPLVDEMNYLGRISVPLLIDRLPTLNWSVPHLLKRMFREWREWGLQWWLIVAALISSPRRALRSPEQFLVWNLLGSLAALLVAGMVAPAELQDHLNGSTHRYLMQLVPVAVLLVMSLWRPPERT